MLHKSKGKWNWQNKATYCVSWSLSPVIFAYLKQLLKNKDSDGFGVPQYFCNKQAKIQGIENWHEEYDKEDSKFDLNAAHKLHIAALEELVWTFSQQSYEDEPKMADFGLTYEFPDGEKGVDGLVYSSIECIETKPNAHAEYTKASKEYHERLEAGYKLFGEIYKHGLDW